MNSARTIAIEEHYWDAELARSFSGVEASQYGPIEQRLLDFAGDRVRDMADAGIDVSVLSHGAPSGQRLDADIAVPLIRRVNDRLAAVVQASGGRYAAFAALPTAVPKAAADELERCVAMGFRGAMIHGMSNGEWLDLPKFWPIYARAEQLDVPIYFHPSLPHPAVIQAYYADYMDTHPLFARPGWGFGVECGTQGVRLLLSGVFERHPGLKVILGHLGESLPFQIWRVDSALSRPGGTSTALRDMFHRNFWITTSGFFSTPALMCCLMEMGADRILFAVDWPFVAESAPGADWARGLPLSPSDRAKILGGNAAALLKL
jgi:2,3-dihydroxybenzoate decarboxylase